jgi:hypothetical protein
MGRDFSTPLYLSRFPKTHLFSVDVGNKLDLLLHNRAETILNVLTSHEHKLPTDHDIIEFSIYSRKWIQYSPK